VSGNGQLPSSGPPGVGKLWLSGAYGLMIVATIGIFFLIRAYGQTLAAPAPEAGGQAGSVGVSPSADVFLHVLLALTAVVVTGRALSKLFTYLGQPPVIGEVVAGICLGPSLLGWIAPGVSAYILPPSVAPSLSVVSQLGIVLYMFLVGLEMNAGHLQERAHATVATSHASIIAPFLLGAGLALGLYPRLSTSDVPFTSFALFMGVAMSITAFPVLARILTDHGMQKTKLGVISLGCAATDYVTAWCLLALVVGVAQARVDGAAVVAALTVVYVGFMFLVVRPVAQRFAARYEKTRLTQAALAIVLVALLLSALATELIGVHAIFGAFLLGAMIPHDSAIARTITAKIEDLVTVLLLPAFFAFAGMRTQIGLVSGLENWLICGVIIFVATAGKFGGSCLGARLTGLGWRESAQLGVLMNTRGLMELIVLNIGLDLKVISPTLFAMMVIMALVTTMGTGPLLRLLSPKPAPQASTVTEQPYQPDLAHAGCG
jgi:Kef-type K+ transport system membrane component KefB